ncbi:MULTISPECIES: hypothetical protein [Moorena]|nr:MULTISPECIES: hypothetical protein [Moorena]
MHGIYIYMNPDYSQSNWFNHTQPLPDFYWHAEKTDMNCLLQILSQVERTGYAHHIQRLMVLSNFALIVGVSPQSILGALSVGELNSPRVAPEEWFHGAFIDAYDWVMQTNVIGMGQFADGGILASKPYAASANYINKMSDYCSSCAYNPRKRSGEGACPFNFLYWDFLCRHRDQLKAQGRMSLVLSHLNKISDQDIQQIREETFRWRRYNISDNIT